MTTQYLTLAGPPMIALFISGWLRDAKIPKWVDTIIAFLVVLLTAFIWALFAGKLVGDLPADTVVIAAYTAALIAGPMAALHAYLTVKWPSPFSAFMNAASAYVPEAAPPAVVTPPVTVTPSRLMPRSVTLPTTSEIVQRNSLLGSDPTWRPTVAVAPAPDATPALKSTEPVTAPVPVVNSGTQSATPAAQPTPDEGDQAAPPLAS